MRATPHVSRALATMFALAAASVAFAADGGDWTVSKSSGEVWLTGSGVQQAALRQEDVLKPGDTISTGRTGRVLLKRGDEMILVSPNSVVGVPAEKKEGLSTTIKQQAGSILLDVEKRNVKHFEVETPYLAAVVKGTRFRVTVNAGKTTVDVVRGQVEVADFKSGQIAQVMAGQHATAFANGKTSLSLGGTGTLAPIEQGKPRAPSVERIPVPRGGFTAIRHATNGQGVQPLRHASVQPAKHGVTRISSSIGEVRVNFHRVTNGLAHAATSSGGVARGVADTNTVWNSSGSDSAIANNGQGDNGNGAAASAAGRGNASAVAAVAGGNANSGNGNNSGNDNAASRSGNGANGSGRGNGHANNGGGNGRGH
ncbi:FecR family protein [Bradyrhizobium sp. AZCC 1693]|uniref:FecR family protein n=1 Tax=Bradyrhizobium sp. AZCC 1693 TaxID=3117029 RepID=UPI002FF3BAB4